MTLMHYMVVDPVDKTIIRYQVDTNVHKGNILVRIGNSLGYHIWGLQGLIHAAAFGGKNTSIWLGLYTADDNKPRRSYFGMAQVPIPMAGPAIIFSLRFENGEATENLVIPMDMIEMIQNNIVWLGEHTNVLEANNTLMGYIQQLHNTPKHTH